MIAPTTAKPPLEANALEGLSSWASDRLYVGACPYAWPWNVTGWPGISVPAGFVDGLPVGAQLLGQARSEDRLIALAAQLERELAWDQQRPPGFGCLGRAAQSERAPRRSSASPRSVREPPWLD